MARIEPEVAEFRPVSGVYALIDPRSSRVMYVGQSLDIEYRYRQHLNTNLYDGHVEKHRWIDGLKAEGRLPKLIVLARCDYPDSDQVEKDYIKLYKSNGQCELNRTMGGVGVRSGSRVSNSHKDDWFQLGLKVKLIRELIFEAVQEAGRLGGPKLASFVLEASRVLDRAKAKLEAKARVEFPDWTDVFRVFYGPNDPDMG